MELTSPKTIKELLAKYQTKPSKRLGQNFLIDKNVLDKIIKSAAIKPDDVVLEVGPGIGTLTQGLAQKVKKVIAIEKDETMVEILKETLKAAPKGEPRQGRDFKNIEVINGDILKLNHPVIRPGAPSNDGANYKLVANIPYYLTSPLIRKFLESNNPPSEMILMLQKEVAQRICSKPPDMNLLAVSVQFYAEPKIVSYVSKNCFWPAPKVDSAIIKISQIRTNSPQIDTNLFFKIVKAGFSQPRKQIAGNLSKILKLDKEKTSAWLSKSKIDPKQRAETLSISDWVNLTKTFLQ